jgi:ankyrin repeat protein
MEIPKLSKSNLAAVAKENAKNDYFATPLYGVANHGNKEIVGLLICSENLILAFGKLHL